MRVIVALVVRVPDDVEDLVFVGDAVTVMVAVMVADMLRVRDAAVDSGGYAESVVAPPYAANVVAPPQPDTCVITQGALS